MARVPLTREIQPTPGAAPFDATAPVPGPAFGPGVDRGPAPGADLAFRSGGSYVAASENLLLTTMNTAASIVLNVGIRWVDAQGRVVQIIKSYALNTTGAPQLHLIPVAGGVGGWVDGVYIYASSGTPTGNSTWAELGIMVGSAANRAMQTKILTSGYVSATQGMGYGTTTPVLFGQGYFQYQGAGPAAFPHTFQTGGFKRWRVHEVFVDCQTAAPAANRWLLVHKTSAGPAVAGYYQAQVSQPANQQIYYMFGPCQDTAAALASPILVIKSRFGPIYIDRGDSLVIDLINKQAGDVGQTFFSYEEYDLPS